MRCPDAREAMLTVERRELRPDGSSSLAAHLRDCAPCRAAAAHLDAATTLLASAVVVRPRAAGDRRPRWSTRRVAWVAALPVAAAIIGIIVVRARGASRAPEHTMAPATASVSRGAVVSVDVAPGQTATVLKTRDPKVTIVWLSPGGGL